MDVRANEADFSEVFKHQEWVRALALRLCGDQAAAEDLVQDTWVEALRDRGGVRSVRAWLGGIVRHRWRRDRLRSSARAEREAGVARSSAREMPSPEGLLAQAELQRRVLAAVASLDEAARNVVLLRYYEGLSSEAIAARLGEPGSTVRNRLARAHEKLRQHLDGEYGDHAWSTLFVPAAIHHLSPIHTGIGVAMKLKLAATAAVLVAGSALLWRTMHAPEERAVEASPALAKSESSSEKPLESAVDAPAPAQTAQRAPAPLAAQHREESLLLFGALRGPTPEQARDGSLRLIEADGASREISVGANATYSAFGLHSGTVHVHANLRGFVPADAEIVLPSDSSKVEHDLVLTPAFLLPVKFVERSTGKPLLSPREFDGPRVSAVATRDRPTRIPNVVGRLAVGGDAGWFRAREPYGENRGLPEGCDGLLEIHPPLPVWVDFVMRDTVLESRLVHGNEKEIVFEIDRAELDAALGSARLRCIENGRPVEGANVTLGFQDGGQQQRGTTDADGEVVIAKVPPGLQRLEVTKTGTGSHHRMVHIQSKDETDLGTIELVAGTSISGHVLDQDGQPVGARVAVFPLSREPSPRTVDCYMAMPCGAGGAFEIKNVERGPSRVVVQAKGFALRVIDVNTNDVQPLEVRMERGTLVRFRVAQDADAYTNFLLADANGVPIRMEGASSSYVREEMLAPGRYQCWSLEDDRIVRRDTFEVSGTAMIQEVR